MELRKYKTIIYECYDLASLDAKNLYNSLNDDGSLFIITDYISDGLFIQPTVFEIADHLIKNKFYFINNLVCINEKPTDLIKGLRHTYYHVIWLAKNLNELYFDKDKIREKHIWKDVEWGKRAKNYNSKGKDPGNVWIPTEDDGKANITKHIFLSKEDIIRRCLDTTVIKDEHVFIKSNLTYLNYPDINIDFLKFDKKKQPQTLTNLKPKNELQHKEFDGTGEVYFKSCEDMKEIESNSINLMVTSPPYWDLKNYFKEGQIGYKESYEKYLERIKNVWKETYRVLKDDGSMWININTRTVNKKPYLIPFDIIKHCLELGFKLVDVIIWHKSSGIPTHDKNIVDRFEYFIWFAKSDSFKYNPQLIEKITDYKNDLMNKGDIWNINRKAGSVGKNFIHPAIYPTKLIDRIIELCTTEGDLVLDPFLGSGTSMISSINNKRSFIGYEFNEGFIDLIEHRVKNEIINDFVLNSHYLDKASTRLNIMRK